MSGSDSADEEGQEEAVSTGNGDLRQRIDAVQERIAKAAARAGRRVDEVQLVAVSKSHPAGQIAAAYDAGLRVFGENRVQEAQEKIPLVGRPAVWHLVGHLQSNKAAAAARLFHLIHSVDDAPLARRLDRAAAGLGRPLEILVQVNVAGEDVKSGIEPDRLRPLLEEIARDCGTLRVRGLMTIPPLHPDPEKSRPHFARLRELAAFARSWGLPGAGLDELSMGMTDDFPVAIEEGATLVRIGRALFGERISPAP
jgi:hypothetical protein